MTELLQDLQMMCPEEHVGMGRSLGSFEIVSGR